MTDLVPLSELRSSFPEGLERLYRLEVERWEPPPAASASRPPQDPSGFARYAQHAEEPEPQRDRPGQWVRAYLISESEDRVLDDIAEEVLDFIGSTEAKWRIRIFYWEGQMHNDYYHVDRKRGETVREADLVEIDTTRKRVR